MPMSVKEAIKEVLRNNNGIADYQTIYEGVSNIRNDGVPFTIGQKAGIRKQIEDCSSDSDNYKNKEDAFFSVDGIGKGVWGLREYISEKTLVAYDSESNEEPLRVKTEIYRILRDTENSKKLKLLYNNTCQICGTQISLNNKFYSEAHHIKPLGSPYNGPDVIDNLIVVCPNCHVKLDYGAIKIENLKIKKHNISEDFIKYHNEELFGKK